VKLLELWDYSGILQKETFFQSQIKSVGMQKSKYMERYQKNMSGSKRSALFVSFFSSLFLLIYSALPIISLIHISSIEITITNVNDQLFSNSLVFSSYYLINFIYYFVIGFLAMIEFLQGKPYKLLRTLPLSQKDIQKVTIFTIIRMNGLQLLVIIFSVPIATYFLLKNSFLVGVILFINIINALFMFYLFIFISNFLGEKVFNNSKTSKLYTLIRISVSLIYLVSMFSVSYIVQFLPSFIQNSILSKYFGTQESLGVNIVLSVILFPFSSGYFISLSIIPTQFISSSIIISTFVGILAFIICTLILMRKGNRVLQSLIFESGSVKFTEKKKHIKSDQIRITVSRPQIAYIKRILIMATREQGKLVVFIIPILFPLIMGFSINRSSNLVDPFFSMFAYLIFIPLMLNNGLIEAEEGLGGLISSLPIKNLDIFRSKQFLMVGILLTSSFLFIIISGINLIADYPESAIKLIFLTIMLPTINLLLYSIFFGKINNYYTLFKINNSNSVVKYLIILVSQISLTLLVVFLPVQIEIGNLFANLIIQNIFILIILDIIIRILIK
jgi:hypothetical protein